MASVDWHKANVQKAGAMIKHNGKLERVSVNHSNKDIDKSKSHLNIYIGADDYRPMLEKVKKRIKEVDEKYPPKRNMGDKRVTCILLETPVPYEIYQQGKAEEFLRNAHKVIEDFFGKENVGGTCGHFDEVHTYIDKDGEERESLVHGHTIVAAYAEWKDKTGERKGINGKHCETKKRLNALNEAMNDMCIEKYGVRFMIREKPEKKSVERLKRETALRAEEDKLKKQIAEQDKQLEQIQKELSKTTKAKQQAEQQAKQAEQRVKQANEQAEQARQRAEKAERQAEQRVKQADERTEQAKQRAEQAERSLSNLLGDIPPLVQKDKPPKPKEPIEVKPIDSYYVEEVKQNKKDFKEYQKQKREYDKKILPAWEKECALIDKENERLRADWESKYLTADNLTIAQKQVNAKQSEIHSVYYNVLEFQRQAKSERDEVKTKSKELDKAIKEQQENVQKQAEIVAKQMFNKMLDDRELSRLERLEQFCDDIKFDDGLTALEVFEERERRLEK